MIWGLPKDGPALVVLLTAVLLAFLGARAIVFLREARLGERRTILLFAASASILSSLYIVFYLRGGPRIIDATSYFLEAKLLASGHLSFPIAEPSTSVLGRFLVADPTFDHASVIFPPGYPALLALGFLAGVPLAVGPILGAAIAALTYDLAKELASADEDAAKLASIAAFLSVTCAALRYHTADTMAHGFAAVLFASAVAALLRVERNPRFAVITGLALGALVATRPFSALALAAVLTFGLFTRAKRDQSLVRPILFVALASLPGVALLLAHNHVATGSVFGSAQRLYYATSDGPEGCFRYGFGANVGCLHEHGDFVRANLRGGFGALAATMTTLRRLKMHLLDAMNAEPLALLPLAGIVLAIRAGAPHAKLFAFAIAAQILAYVPFYFDGNYPGGGARFFVEILPFEHAFAAFAILALARRAELVDRSIAGLLALPLLGFAFRASFDHARLRDRDGGRPMFEESVLKSAKVDRGVLFVDTDHGFDLAFDPDPRARVVVARRHDDASDTAIWDALGRPTAHAYRFDFATGLASIDPIDPAPLDALLRGPTLWPARAQRGAFAIVEWPGDACLSGAVLSIEGRGAVDLPLPASLVRGRTITPHLYGRGAATLTLTSANTPPPVTSANTPPPVASGTTPPPVTSANTPPPVTSGTTPPPVPSGGLGGSRAPHRWKSESSSEGCRALEPFDVPPDATELILTIEKSDDYPVSLEKFVLGHR